VAGELIAALDRDRDGEVGPGELSAYADRLLAGVRVSIDGRRLAVRRTGEEISRLSELRDGVGTLRITARAPARRPRAGPHELVVALDHPSPDRAYLANALAPTSEAVVIERQERNPSQTRLRVAYRIR
jgi:hypothetical protein